MPEDTSHQGQPVHSDVRYEKGDLRIGPVLAVGAALMVLAFIVHGALAWMFNDLKDEKNRNYPGLPALAAKERPKLPKDVGRIPEPRLQIDEPLDVVLLRRAEEARLSSYGWVDAKKGIVRIPINEAMRLLADPAVAEKRGIHGPAPRDKGPAKGGRP